MEAFGILKFWRNNIAGDEVRAAAFATDDEETDEDNSFFDLVFKSPARKGSDEGSKKDFQFIESPRDVLKNDFTTSKPLSPAVTLLRSTPKFKVFMLGFRKSSRCERSEANCQIKTSPSNQYSKSLKIGRENRCSVKCRVEELPNAPVLARENSSRSGLVKQSLDQENSSDVVSQEKSLPKYLKLIKPFYVKASKKLSDSTTPSSSPITAPVNLPARKFSEGSRAGSFKIVVRNLGKGRSDSGVGIGVGLPPIRRRDDSLLEKHDGIQGAILHCKKSYSSSCKEYSNLFPSPSHSSHIESFPCERNSFEERKRCSI